MRDNEDMEESMEVCVEQPYAAFGRRVRDLREAKGLSRKELARKAGISYAYIRAIESGHRMPTIAVLDAIAVELGVSTSVLLQESGELPESPEAQAVRLVEGVAAGLLRSMVPVRNQGAVPAELDAWESRGLMAATVDVPAGWLEGHDPGRYFVIEVMSQLPGVPIAPGEQALCERMLPGVELEAGDTVVIQQGAQVTLVVWPGGGDSVPLGVVVTSWREHRRP